MTRRRKICFAVLITMLLCVIGLLVFVLPKGKKYSFSYLETSKYLPLDEGELMELTETGTVYVYYNDGSKEMLLESSDIISQSVIYGQNTSYILNVHKDGSLKMCKGLSFDEWEIVRMEGMIKADLCAWGLMVLTEDGTVYEYEDRELFLKLFGETTIEITLQKNEELPKCMDICSSDYNRVVITKDGEVYVKGRLAANEYAEYKKIECPSRVSTVYNSGNTLLALSDSGILYEAGMEIYKASLYILDKFEIISEYENVVQMDGSYNKVVLLEQDSDVYYFGETTKGKASGISWKGQIRYKTDVKKVYMRDGYIYILGEDYLYLRKVADT